MAYIVPDLAETRDDQLLYTRSRLQQVPCMDCAARVSVRKNSEHHTSIQWTEEAVANCQTFAKMSREEGGRPVHAVCPRLNLSIEEAVRNGTVPVGSDDDEPA